MTNLRFNLLGVFGPLSLGLMLWAWLIHAWMTPGNEWVVHTIMPGMLSPYIIATFCIWVSVEHFWVVMKGEK